MLMPYTFIGKRNILEEDIGPRARNSKLTIESFLLWGDILFILSPPKHLTRAILEHTSHHEGKLGFNLRMGVVHRC